jgi:hypothetical protein
MKPVRRRFGLPSKVKVGRDDVPAQTAAGCVEAAQPGRRDRVITDNLSKPLRLLHWHLAGCPSAHPPGVHPGRRVLAEPAGGLVAQLRRDALAGQSLARSDEITLAIEMATCQLNARARRWVWGPLASSPRD